MRIGIGLPGAILGSDASRLGDWAATAESFGFASLPVIDRLVYDNLEPLVVLAAAAIRTRRVELLTTVLNVATGATQCCPDLPRRHAPICQPEGRRIPVALRALTGPLSER